jgi:hypothetical protein
VNVISTIGSAAAEARNASRLRALGDLVDVEVDDAAARKLAEWIGGCPSVRSDEDEHIRFFPAES